MEDLDAASLDDVRSFFETYYRPDNAVLTIAGDFDRDQVRRWVETHFGPIPSGNGRPAMKDTAMPDVFGAWKREVVPDNVMLPRLFLAFLSPVFGSEKFYAASVCAAILGMKKGSRLFKALVRERQVAAEAHAFTYDLTKGSDVLVLDVTGRPGVSAEQLEQEVAREVDQLVERYPRTRLVYIGDKTFGQSRESVDNLLTVFADRPGFRFIVQTHVLALHPWVLDAMSELGVVAVEMGFESADTELLRAGGKLSRGLDDYHAKLCRISDRGIGVVLNVMGGLAAETEASHFETARWLRDCADVVWLANLYNFVPYPLIPDFDRLQPRIHDWNYANWREDAPVVFRPYHLTPERSWELFLEKVSVMTDVLRSRTAGAFHG